MFQSELLPLPPSRPSFKLAILLLLAGDVSLNPGPFGSNERLKIATMNVRSIKPKTAPFSEYVTSKNPDIVAVTKTWLKHDETKSTIADISPPGYSFFHECRADQRAGGGGVGILVSDQLKTDIHPLPSFKTFGAISARIGNNSLSGFVVCLYRLQNGTCKFFDKIQDLLENIISLHDNLYILGNFNLHLDNSSGNTNKLNEILTCFDLKQHGNFPTHVHGHWLDLLITKRISNSIKSVFLAAGISDHLAVISEIDCCETKWNKEKISFRKINKIDYESFHSDILILDLIKKPEKDLSALCQQYDYVLSFILDKHAPVSTKTLPRKPPTPWMTPEIMKAKTLRHNFERTWRRSRTHLDRSRYKHQCHLCNKMMTKVKSKYLADVISENSGNPRRLWNTINNILHRIPPPALPDITSVKSLCDHFSRYFVDKIETTRSKFPDKVQNIPQVRKPVN